MDKHGYDCVQLGCNIRTHRLAQGLTQAALAQRVGCSPQTICKLERGLCGISVELLFQLCSALRCSASVLAKGL